MFFFFKQKTAYEMRISDWSPDVCSSDIAIARQGKPRRRSRLIVFVKMERQDLRSGSGGIPAKRAPSRGIFPRARPAAYRAAAPPAGPAPVRSHRPATRDRTVVVKGRSVYVRCDIGGWRISI